tara:strand:+ start:24148 stop:24738 length:591 start_codon:yes stop_codon:yes gene_type:complete
MATTFDKILAQGIRKGKIPARNKSAREWYRNLASDTQVSPSKLTKSNKKRFQKQMRIGEMYMYYYNPKHKRTLPYYDRFPLVFPFNKAKGGFLGINLHYLPLTLRAKLMDALYTTTNNKKYDETTRLKINYDILNSSAKMKYFKPCVKHYLTEQLDSRLWYVYPSEWDIALWLPLERFKKAKKTEVWQDSRQIIKG